MSNFLKSFKEKIQKRQAERRNAKALKKLQELDKKLVLNLSKKSKFKIFFPSFKQIKHLKKFLSPFEKKIIWINILVILICVVFIGYLQYKNHVFTIPAFGGEYNEGLIGSPKLINPLIAQADADLDLVKLIYSSLLKYNKDLQIIPDIAQAYEISDDQKEYTFHLKNNVFWHDNEALNADDVVFTFNRIKDPSFNSPLFLNFDGVFIEKIDDLTVKFTLNEPYSPFLNTLTFGVLPEHIWDNVEPSQFSLAEYNIKPIGSGPYKFKSLIKDKSGNIKSITLETFTKYHGVSGMIENLIFKFYPDFTQAYDGLINKNIQGLSKLPKENIKDMKANARYNLYNLKLAQYNAVFFNLSKKNVWENNELRQALAYGVDKEKLINDILNNQAYEINGPILPGNLGYKEDLQNYGYNPDMAASLIAKAGYQLNSENFYEKEGKVLKITLTTIDKYDNVDVANALKSSWEQLGVKVELEIVPFSDIKQKIKQRNYEAILYGELVGADPDPYPFWHSTQRVDPGLNLSMFANKKADELIEQARQISNTEIRKEKYEEFSLIISQEVPAIFLYSPYYQYVQENSLKGFQTSVITTPSERFNGIEKWYIKEKKAWK